MQTAEQQKINIDNNICIYMTFIGNSQWADNG